MNGGEGSIRGSVRRCKLWGKQGVENRRLGKEMEYFRCVGRTRKLPGWTRVRDSKTENTMSH